MEALVSPQFLHNPKASVSTVGYGDDGAVHALFDDEFVKNDYKSEREARAVYDHFYCIELQWPGDNTKTFKYRFPTDQTRNEYIERFPKQWAAFKDSKEQTPDGTPIEVWPPLDKKRVFELRANKIYTVEQIAALTDSTGPSLGLDWRKIRDQAVAFLSPAATTVQLSKLARENEDLKLQMEALRNQMSNLSSDETPEKKKPGRKPKIVTTEAA